LILFVSLGSLRLFVLVLGAGRLLVLADAALASLRRFFVRRRARRLGEWRLFRDRRRRARIAARATLGDVPLLRLNGVFQLEQLLGVELVPDGAAVANVGRCESVVDNVNRMFQAVGPFDSGALHGNKVAIDRKVLEAVDFATKAFVHHLLQIEILIGHLKLQRANNFVSYRDINIKLTGELCEMTTRATKTSALTHVLSTEIECVLC
jgi:hypothetical protein